MTVSGLGYRFAICGYARFSSWQKSMGAAEGISAAAIGASNVRSLDPSVDWEAQQSC